MCVSGPGCGWKSCPSSMSAFINRMKIVFGVLCGAGDSWHSSILISESSFLFADELSNFRHYLTSTVPCLKGSANTNPSLISYLRL